MSVVFIDEVSLQRIRPCPISVIQYEVYENLHIDFGSKADVENLIFCILAFIKQYIDCAHYIPTLSLK